MMIETRRMIAWVGVLTLWHGAWAQGASLVPDTPSTVPDYFCTWNVQGFACSYSGASPQADKMVESSLFGTGTNQNWLGFYPDVRADLTFLLDDAFDFPLGGGHNDPRRGSIELDSARFPSCTGTPGERLAKLSKDVKAKGWRDLGLWICNSRPNVEELKIDSDTYWCERLKWSQDAGIGNWKVDWGIGMPNKPLWKFKLTPKARATAPDIWIEQGGSGAVGDLYRTYDVGITVSIPETIRRIAAFLKKGDTKDRRLITCEDEVYIGAGLGCAYGIMRHPLTDNMPNGKPDEFFKPHFRDVKRRLDEVTRAVRWHRIAHPFPKGDVFIVDSTELNDAKSKPAPARIARGGLALPIVTMPDGSKEPPYVLCSRHLDGEIAVATIPRNISTNGARPGIVFPLAEVTLEIGELNRPVGIFGEYASLTLVTSSDLAGKRILAQDLAGHTPVDVTAEVKCGEGRLVIPGAVIRRVGRMAGKPGDVSDPGLVLAVEGLTTFAPKKPMKPGMYMAMGLPEGAPPAAISAPPNPLEKNGWVLDRHDEFNGPDLNTSLWIPFYLESRTERERAAARYEFKDGNLILFVDGAAKGYFKDGPSEMTVSGIQTGDRTRLHKDADAVHHEIPLKMNYAPKYGYFEIRAKLPSGGHAAFWAVGVKDEPEQAGEIDIFESIPKKPNTLKFVIHTWGDKKLKYQSLRPEVAFNPTSGVHIYALEWNEKECLLFIDNRQVARMEQAPAYPCVFLLTLYGNTRDSSRQEFVVDYFRAYRKAG